MLSRTASPNQPVGFAPSSLVGDWAALRHLKSPSTLAFFGLCAAFIGGVAVARFGILPVISLIAGVVGLYLLARPELSLAVAVAAFIVIPSSLYVLAEPLSAHRLAVILPVVFVALRRFSFDGFRAADVFLLMFISWALISWAVLTPVTNADWQRPAELLLPLAFYLWARIFGERRGAVEAILWTLLAAGSVVAATVIYEGSVGATVFANPNTYYWNASSDFVFRPGGISGSPPGAALILSMALPVGAWLLLQSQGLRRYLCWAACVLLFVACALTLVRGSLIAIALTIPIFLYAATGPRGKQRLILVLVAAAATLAFLVPTWSSSTWFDQSVRRAETLQVREGFWEQAGPVITYSAPAMFVGQGFDALASVREGGKAELPLAAARDLVDNGSHNQYIFLTLELGLVGLALFLAWVGSSLAAVRRSLGSCSPADRTLAFALTAGVAAFLLAGLVGDHVRFGPGLMLLALYLGLAQAVSSRPTAQDGAAE